jgi:hypothetical protein
MRFTSTVIVGTPTRCQCVGTQQAVWCRYGPLALAPFGFDRSEPRTFGGQPAGDNADALPRPLDGRIRGAYPGAHRLTCMQEAFSQPSSSAVTPCAARRALPPARQAVGRALTGRPVTKRPHLCSAAVG